MSTPGDGPAPVSAALEPGYTWRARMPRGVLDPRGPRGEPITTPADRRMLWYLESVLAATAANDTLRQAAIDLHAYLHQTCEHHWLGYEGDEEIPDHRQCLWCAATEPLREAPLTAGHAGSYRRGFPAAGAAGHRRGHEQ